MYIAANTVCLLVNFKVILSRFSSGILDEQMPSFKHGATFGGCFVIQHQKEEAMAAVLLAWKGDYTVKNHFRQ